MILYHWTPIANVASVKKHGLLTSKARTVDGCVYMFSYGLIDKLRKHAAARHKVSPSCLALFRASRTQKQVQRVRGCIFKSKVDVPVEQVAQPQQG